MTAAAAKNIYRTEAGANGHALIAEYANPADLTHAAEKVRDAGYTRWDVFSPFPVHGMEEAMGVPPSRLPLLVAILGLTGAALGFIFQWWVTAVAYKMVVQGKPYDAWQPWVPVGFEIGVLFTAFTCILGMFAFNGLPRPHHPLLCNQRFLRVSDDKFIIAIESEDPRFDPKSTRDLLQSAGAVAVEVVEET